MGLQGLKVHGVAEVKSACRLKVHGVAKVKSAWGCKG